MGARGTALRRQSLKIVNHHPFDQPPHLFSLLPTRLLAQKMLPLGRKITASALIYYMKTWQIL
jgi:hypothetical protein